jgi:hypothetical protein
MPLPIVVKSNLAKNTINLICPVRASQYWMKWLSRMMADFFRGRRLDVSGKEQSSSLHGRLRRAEVLTISGMVILFATTLIWTHEEIGRWAAAQSGVIADPFYITFTLPFGWTLAAIGMMLLAKEAGKTKLPEDQWELTYRMKTTGGVVLVMSVGALLLSSILFLLGFLFWLTIGTYTVTTIIAVRFLVSGFRQS